MSIESNEFAAVAVSNEQLVSWPRVAAVAAMVSFSLPTFVMGLEVSRGLLFADLMWALVLGSLILFVIGGMMGVIGTRTRMSSYLLVRIAFGDKGAGLVNIAFAISLLGWFGVNINLFTDAVAGLSHDVFNLDMPILLITIIGSVCMTVTTLVGFRAINILSSLMIPILVIITGLLIHSALNANSLGEIFAIQKETSLTLGQGISSIVGGIIIGAIILPDITRFVRQASGAVYVVFIAYMLVGIVVMAAAGMAGAASGSVDIIEIMLELGLGIGAFLIVIAGSWVLNSLNLYSAVLSVQATFPEFNSKWTAIILGALGVLFALMNILDHFITFLFYLSVIFIPVAGVIIVDFLLIRPNEYNIESLDNNRQINSKGLLAWGVSAVVAILASEGIIPALSTIAAIDAVVLAGVLYAVFSWNERNLDLNIKSA